jgi:hypothetical protein
MEQRWLSKIGICTVLGINESTLKTLVKQNYIVKIGTHPNIRYLDPTPEYAEQLRLGQALHRQHVLLGRDLSTAALFTLREIAEILGLEIRSVQAWIWRESYRYLFKGTKVGKYHLYSAEDVRNLIWKRHGRKRYSKQKSPFLLPELIAFFHKIMDVEIEDMPTDAQFEEDEVLQRKIKMMLRQKSPGRERALADFMAKVELAKQVVTATLPAKASHRESDTHPPNHSAL